jgi:Tol biopolymer transport system component
LLSLDLVSIIAPSLLASTGNEDSSESSISSDGRYVAFRSAATNLVAGDTNGFFDIFVKDLQTETTTRVSTDFSGTQANDWSSAPSISGDGRYVAFRSAATNLVTGDTNGFSDIFVKDLQTGTIARVSTRTDGTQGNGQCYASSISGDGHYVAFESDASNLVAGDTVQLRDIFVKDVQTGTTTRVSTATDGSEGWGDSYAPSISGDGRYVAFCSYASNLVPGDTYIPDIYVKDVQTGTTTLVSTHVDGTRGNGESAEPSVSGNGRYVAFRSYANNLVAGDTNGDDDIFVKDLQTGSTTRVSTHTEGTQGNAASCEPSISGDGRYVAFHSEASNLVAGDTNEGADFGTDIFVKDVQTGNTTRVSTATDGSEGWGDSYAPSISGDGRYVAFQSNASNLVAGDLNGLWTADIFVKDVQTGSTETASDAAIAQWGGNGFCDVSSISGDGRYVAFDSVASNLVPGDTIGFDDIFVRDLQTGTTSRVSTDSNGNQGLGGDSYGPSISGDGRYVAFTSRAYNLVVPSSVWPDVFVKDVQTGTTTLVSSHTDGTLGNSDSCDPSISGDGRYVAFTSYASNFVAGDTNGWSDVFVKDLQTGTTTRVSTHTDGTQGNGESSYPSISGDGRYVAFQSLANNLVAGDTDGQRDIFIKDLETGTTTRVSTHTDGTQGNGESSYPSISGDGRYVAFQSLASNLVAGDTNGREDVFVKDIQTGTTTRVSTNSSGNQGNSESRKASISGDGRYVAFHSVASNLVAGDTNGGEDVFVKDIQTATSTRVSTNSSGTQGNGASLDPSISSDGRYVAFTSAASNLHPDDTSTISDVFRWSSATSDTIGLYSPTTSTFYLRDHNTAGTADLAFNYGPANLGWTTMAGDWNSDGIDTVGLYDPVNAVYYLRNVNAPGNADIAFAYGPPGAGWEPVVGDWNGDGMTTVGLFNPVNAVFYLRNTHAAGYADYAFAYGAPGAGWKPVIGDWDGDGDETVGLYDPNNAVFYLRNGHAGGASDVSYAYGPPGLGWQPVVGDWNADGIDTVGVYNPTAGTFYLRNTHSPGAADVAFNYGPPGLGWKPAIGDWNGPGASLMAAGGEVAAAGPVASLVEGDLDSIVAQAIADWAGLGLATDQLEALVDVRFVIADLPGAQLGLAERDTIFLDLNAAGHGWFVDPTPASDEEFIVSAAGRLTAIDPAAIDRIDLLTVVSHELSHTLGLGDLDASVETLMSGTLETGLRREPGVEQIVALLTRL